LEEARERVADAVGARRGEIYFVRGGTESDNLAILGRAEATRAEGGSDHVVITAIEHRAVLEASAKVAERGGRRTVLSVRPDGTIDLDDLEQALQDRPAVVSVMTVNNEVGIHLPVQAIAERTRASGVTLHTDAVQAIGKVPVRVDTVPVDLLSLTGHKIYGAKGTGVLFVREGVEVSPLIFGGGQERALRPGTEDVAGAVGMSVAVDLAVRERESEAPRLSVLRDALQSRLTDGLEGLRVHGETARRAPHILNVGIPGVDPQLLLAGLDMEGIAASAGSACESGGKGGSHVLEALYGPMDGVAALRFSVGRSTTEEDIGRVAETTLSVVASIRGRVGPA
jgi:cysteine desulfurase